MRDVLIDRVASYEDVAGIMNFVDNVFDQDEDLRDFLGAFDADRLVVVKPNWVQESHEFEPNIWEPVITHPALVLAVVEALAERMKGKGTVSICDAPHTYADFDTILSRGGLNSKLDNLRAKWPSLKIEVLDLRREIWLRKEQVVTERIVNVMDPRGYVVSDLGRESFLNEYHGEGRYYGADYDTNEVNDHHSKNVHQYMIAGTPMQCDLFVNLPKMKTHKKTGITCCLKNLVGVNGNKNWLPHHTEGSPESGGDEFPQRSFATVVESKLKSIGMRAAMKLPIIGTLIYRKTRKLGVAILGASDKTIRNGNWSGNDTTWRMALDLNRCILYGNMDGSWRDLDGPKKYVAIVDGIVGGEGDGPLMPTAVSSNVLVGGFNPATVDAVVAKLMGFSPQSLPIVSNAFLPHMWPIASGEIGQIMINDVGKDVRIGIDDIDPVVDAGFQPHRGWQKHLTG